MTGEIAASRRDGIGNGWEERGRAHGAQGRASRRRGVEAGAKGRPLTMGIRSGAGSGFAAQAGVGESRASVVERVRNALLCDALRCATRAMGAMTFTFERKAGEGRNLNWTHTRRRAESRRLRDETGTQDLWGGARRRRGGRGSGEACCCSREIDAQQVLIAALALHAFLRVLDGDGGGGGRSARREEGKERARALALALDDTLPGRFRTPPSLFFPPRCNATSSPRRHSHRRASRTAASLPTAPSASAPCPAPGSPLYPTIRRGFASVHRLPAALSLSSRFSFLACHPSPRYAPAPPAPTATSTPRSRCAAHPASNILRADAQKPRISAITVQQPTSPACVCSLASRRPVPVPATFSRALDWCSVLRRRRSARSPAHAHRGGRADTLCPPDIEASARPGPAPSCLQPTERGSLSGEAPLVPASTGPPFSGFARSVDEERVDGATTNARSREVAVGEMGCRGAGRPTATRSSRLVLSRLDESRIPRAPCALPCEAPERRSRGKQDRGPSALEAARTRARIPRGWGHLCAQAFSRRSGGRAHAGRERVPAGSSTRRDATSHCCRRPIWDLASLCPPEREAGETETNGARPDAKRPGARVRWTTPRTVQVHWVPGRHGLGWPIKSRC
ncbi:hypothetical protein HETIRDRAFT_455548 [Heterobasidion irregulare TC 32-1]|uniref:Uncharacterized protein n=1 Tax=Heterobasidion irregulare (strain TC 32-1) TaxID=747525 RepID=W4JSR9_HETIT|nr:uncharacterized protein HETIRDRAFT_455548 [Heterobasidion irregulare TC 32-1]ETW75906.1 hypothetical protein HETIRDRAFT_455548 [Heterobasidion irregulare TC 32-1]